MSVPAISDHEEHKLFDLCSTSDILTFDHNWHHLHSSSAESKDLSNHTQIWQSGDCLNGVWDMHENAQKCEWKTLSKMCCQLHLFVANSMVKDVPSNILSCTWHVFWVAPLLTALQSFLANYWCVFIINWNYSRNR